MKKFICFLLTINLLVFLFPLNTRAKDITLYFFHGDGCPHCAEEEKFLDKLKEENTNINISYYEVWHNDENAELLKKVQEVYKVSNKGIPLTIIGESYIVGFGDTTTDKIKRAINYYEEHKYIDVISKIEKEEISSDYYEIHDKFNEQETKSDKELSISLFGLKNINLKKISISSAAVLIGLVDGFNPCAMWVLLFLISVLIGMKDRKKMWIYGTTFLLTSALVYMAIMLSWLNIVVKMTTIIWIRNLIGVIAIIGSIVNLKSFYTSKSGCKVVNDKKRKIIFSKIREYTHNKSFFLGLLGIIGLAISVNFIELACSAGLPLVFTQLLAINDITGISAFFYTVVYIMFFLFDDMFIFFIAMLTMNVTGISTKYAKYSHLIGGVLMLLVGILLIFKPEWLMFQFN